MKDKIQVRYHSFGKRWPLEPLRVTFFHPDFDKADLSSIKDIVTLKFRLFKDGKELNKEKIRIKKHSLGCWVCCYSDVSKIGKYNDVNSVNIASLEYAKSLPNGVDRSLLCICLDNLLIDPIVFLYVENHSSADIYDGFIEISDTENFEIVKVEDPQLLYVGSKIDPPTKHIKYEPQDFDFDKITHSEGSARLIKIGEFIEEFKLYYLEKKDNGIIIDHYVRIPVKEIDRYKDRVPNNIEERVDSWYTNLYSDNEENEEMLNKLENNEVIKVRGPIKEEIEELINYYINREDLTREEAIKKIRDDKFMNNLPIFDEIKDL